MMMIIIIKIDDTKMSAPIRIASFYIRRVVNFTYLLIYSVTAMFRAQTGSEAL